MTLEELQIHIAKDEERFDEFLRDCETVGSKGFVDGQELETILHEEEYAEEYSYSLRRVFKAGGKYFEIGGYYGSYSGTEWSKPNDIIEVVPKEVVKIEYHPVNE